MNSSRPQRPPASRQPAAPAATVAPAPDASGGATIGGGTRRVDLPLEPYNRVKSWIRLVIALALCAPALFISLDRAHPTDRAEQVALAVARETWTRYRATGDFDALLIASLNRDQYLKDPPLSTWLTIAAWSDLSPARAQPRQLIGRARVVSAIMALLTVAATYWAGHTLGGVRVALFSALATGTALITIHQCRQVTPHAHMLAWVTLAVAAGLWAMRPFKPVNWVSRRVTGWLTAGLALGAAILTQGPMAAVFVAPPLVAAIVLTPHRRPGNFFGLLFAMICGVIVAAPWYLYVIDHVPRAVERLLPAMLLPEQLVLITWRHLALGLLVAPWVVWLIGALFQPFIRAEAEQRRQLLIAWFWFVLVFTTFSIPAAKNARYLLPLAPAIGLMVGQLFAFHVTLARQRQLDVGVNLLRVPHWAGMAIASVGLPLIIAFQDDLATLGDRVEWRWLAEIDLPGIGPVMAVLLGAALSLITLLGIRWHFYKWQPDGAFYATACWMVVASTIGFHSYAQSARCTNPHLAGADQLAHTVLADEHASLTYLLAGQLDEPPHPAFLFHLGRVIDPVEPQQLAMLPMDRAAYVIVRVAPRNEQFMADNGFAPMFDFSDGAVKQRRLYRRAAVIDPAKAGDS